VRYSIFFTEVGIKIIDLRKINLSSSINKHEKRFMKRFSFAILVFAILFTPFYGCKKNPLQSDAPTQNENDHDEKSNIVLPPYYGNLIPPLLLGNQLQNPYTLSNMQAAVQELANNGSTSTNTIDVRATHEYVKFIPKTTEELLELLKDKKIILYDFPLDYEITRQGNWYRDPEIEDPTKPTYHYASVKKGYNFNSSIEHVVLSELYIPEEDEVLIGPSHRENLEYLDELLEQAYLQTENLEDEQKMRWSWYTPGGTITIFDSRLNQNIPLQGALMTANRWFTTYKTYTDANGNYRMNDQFKRPCDYKLYFQNSSFVIGDNQFQQAKIGHDNRHGDWNYLIDAGYENMQGHMFRGAYRYFLQDVQGLNPPNIPGGALQMIVAKNSNKNWGAGINYVVWPLLKIARYDDNNDEYQSDDFFSATVHELAHTGHVITMNAGALQYSQVSRQIQESWATAVEWFITGLEYKGRGITNYGDFNFNPANPPVFPNLRGGQFWEFISGNTENNRYSSMFINFVDNYNDINFGLPGSPNDAVSGYTLSGIEDNILKHSYGISSLSQYLKSNKPNGVTDVQIDLLLSGY
jgi:hypothetical protein